MVMSAIAERPSQTNSYTPGQRDVAVVERQLKRERNVNEVALNAISARLVSAPGLYIVICVCV